MQRVSLRGRVRLFLDNLVSTEEPLLILAPPFIDSVFSSLALLLARYWGGRITHLTLLSLDNMEHVLDMLSKYKAALVVDPPSLLKWRDLDDALGGGRVSLITRGFAASFGNRLDSGDSSISYLVLSTMGSNLPRDSVKALELSIMNEALSCVECREAGFKDWVDVENLGYPSLPLPNEPLWRSLYLSIMPYIPGITGNEVEARRIVERIGARDDSLSTVRPESFMELLRHVSDRLLRHGFRGDYLDKVLVGYMRWIDGGGLIETLLSVESQLGLWEYSVGLLRPIVEPNYSLELTRDLINKYVKALDSTISRVLESGGAVLEHVGVTLIERVCSILSFSGGRYSVATVLDDWGFLCVNYDAADKIREASERALIYRRRGYVLSFIDSNSVDKLISTSP